MSILRVFNTILFLSLFCLIDINAQTSSQLQKHYTEFIQVKKYEHKGMPYIVSSVKEMDKETKISKMVNNNIRYVNYLLNHFSTLSQLEADLLLETDSIIIQNKGIAFLEKDTFFNKLMKEWEDKTITQKSKKDSVSISQLMNIAVKFFSIIKVDDNGHYLGKVCGGLKDVEKTEEKRFPHIEAFCFSSILENYSGEEYNIYDAFVSESRKLYQINLGIDKAERLLRAQGALYFLMYDNEVLINMLKSEFEKKKMFLPFELID